MNTGFVGFCFNCQKMVTNTQKNITLGFDCPHCGKNTKYREVNNERPNRKTKNISNERGQKRRVVNNKTDNKRNK